MRHNNDSNDSNDNTDNTDGAGRPAVRLTRGQIGLLLLLTAGRAAQLLLGLALLAGMVLLLVEVGYHRWGLSWLLCLMCGLAGAAAGGGLAELPRQVEDAASDVYLRYRALRVAACRRAQAGSGTADRATPQQRLLADLAVLTLADVAEPTSAGDEDGVTR